MSPLLANIYLHTLDIEMIARGYKIIRYADDFVILCKSQEEAMRALEEARAWMKRNELSLHPDKTHVGNCCIKGQGFQFLGYRFECEQRYVRQSSMKSLRDRIRIKTRRTEGKSLSDVVKSLNPMLKGWFEYFKHAHARTFTGIDGFIRRRLRSMLRKQEKRPSFGRCLNDQLEWPNKFFAGHGLFTMHEAHNLARRPR